MTLQDTEKLMRVIKTAYPEFNRDVNPEVAFRLWHGMLEKYDYEACDKALLQHIQECKFAPKISEIIEKVKPTTPQLPSNQSTRYMATEWERRSMRNLCENLGVTLPPEIARHVYTKGEQDGTENTGQRRQTNTVRNFSRQRLPSREMQNTENR